MSHSDARRAAPYLRESAKAASGAGDHFWAALSLSALGMVSLGQGNYDEARTMLAEGSSLAQRAGDRFSRYIALYNRSVLAQAEGDHDGAAALFEEGLAFSREAGDHANVAYCLEGLVAVVLARGRADRAARLLGAAERLREGVGAAVYNYRPDRSLRTHRSRRPGPVPPGAQPRPHQPVDHRQRRPPYPGGLPVHESPPGEWCNSGFRAPANSSALIVIETDDA